MRVKDLSDDPLKQACPLYLYLFSDYYVNINNVGIVLADIIEAMLSTEFFVAWRYGHWFSKSLNKAYLKQNSTTDDDSLGAEADSLYAMCCSMVDNLGEKIDLPEYVRQQISMSIPVEREKLITILNNYIRELALETDATKQHIIVWHSFWTTFYFIHCQAITNRNVRSLIGAWTSFPQIFKDIMRKPPENILKYYMEAKYTSNDCRSLLNVPSSAISHAFCFWNILEHFRVNIVDTNNYLSQYVCSSKCLIKKVNNNNVKGLSNFLKTMHDVNFDDMVLLFFENVRLQNNIFFEYINIISMNDLHFVKIEQINCNNNSFEGNLKYNSKYREIQMNVTQLLLTKFLFVICRNWAEQYIRAINLFTNHELGEHAQIMRDKILKMIKPSITLIEGLLAQTESANQLYPGPYPMNIALQLLSSLEPEIKYCFSIICDIMVEQSSFTSKIESKLNKINTH